jgi:N6-L-threonylcarbamoyladenine synthase
MIVLGIESTAHTFGVAIIRGKSVLADEKDSFTTAEGGMIPLEVAQHHEKVYQEVLDRALKKASIDLNEIELVAYSNAPGFGMCLKVGQNLASSLASRFGRPIVGVNHCIAHLEIGRMLFPACKDPVLLYASGANTQVIAYDGGKYRIFGETLDQGVGNMLDSFARHVGLGFPGGPKIERLALEGKEYVELPYCVKGMDVNFGGILTNIKHKYNLKKHRLEDLAFSLQETVFAMLVEVSERAMAHCDKDELLLGGGVACNRRLQEMCKVMCEDRDAKCFVPSNQYLVDNAVMIAWLGLLMYKAGKQADLNRLDFFPYQRTDDIDVFWR